jgi:hypothetical protein
MQEIKKQGVEVIQLRSPLRENAAISVKTCRVSGANKHTICASSVPLPKKDASCEDVCLADEQHVSADIQHRAEEANDAVCLRKVNRKSNFS